LKLSTSPDSGTVLDNIYKKYFKKRFHRTDPIMKPCDKSIRKTLEMVKAMLEVADQGDAVREDTGCGILYGVVRDSAYRIKKLAEAEKEAHIKKGWWK
jgi:hypothetical protein